MKFPSILYHATYEPLLKDIMSLGLGNTKQTYWDDSVPGVVYLADDPYVAESYAECNENLENESWLDEIVILKIDVNALDKSKLFVDKNVKLDEGEDNATWEYHGVIPWKNIEIFNSTIAESIYEPPYNFEQMKENGYSDAIISKLKNDPAHSWRAETGIELIHKEPSFDEQIRIWKNWNLMNDEQKKLSDEKSIKLFGIDNETHYKQIMNEFYPNRKFDVVYEKIMSDVLDCKILANPISNEYIPDYDIINWNKKVFKYISKEPPKILISENKCKEVNIGANALGYLKSKLSNIMINIDLNILKNKISKRWKYYNDFSNNCENVSLFITKVDFKKSKIAADEIYRILNFNDIKIKTQLIDNLSGSMSGTSALTLNTGNNYFILIDDNLISVDEKLLHEFTHFVQLISNNLIMNNELNNKLNKVKHIFKLSDMMIGYLSNKYEFFVNLYNEIFNDLQKIYWIKYKNILSWEMFIDKIFNEIKANPFTFYNLQLFKDLNEIGSNNNEQFRFIVAISVIDKEFFNEIQEKMVNI